jgi:regulator of nucleoside diphosphate kinase
MYAMTKLLITTENLPEGIVVKEIFGMIQITGTVEVSNKGVIRGLLERNKNEYQEVIDAFIRSAPSEANAIIGVQISTAVQNFNNGTFLYVTYIGTPAVLEGNIA